jgi:hypothetical protein
MVSFTASGTTVVPSNCTNARVVVVGGGQAGTNAGGSSDVAYSIGGQAGTVTVSVVKVKPGETLTATIGGQATASTLVGSYGTVTGAGGSSQNQGGGDGTLVSGWGYFAGQGCGAIKGGAGGYFWAVGAGFPGGGRPTGGVNGYGATNGSANSGAGGSQGTSGGSGFIAINFYY